ncbi:hypothetical protein [Acinetobacter guerrae]|uniref:hypothetical protein n=1 Tax=Acinetobacter guerrae TaxID=1843371 RepID=UPI00128B98EB|nr:hypothetical protein [Acinetobacter guerrae]MPW43389.1 hypothetical protein [Acinetobacter guerrae]
MFLFHTSPKEITKIDRSGKFDDCLFFATTPYSMSVGAVITYRIDAAEMDFINASGLYDEDIVVEIAKRFNVEIEVAESLLDGSDSVWNYDFADADEDWYLQAKRGECAKKMGYDGCKDEDEQGGVYIIPMLGRESILNKEF